MLSILYRLRVRAHERGEHLGERLGRGGPWGKKEGLLERGGDARGDARLLDEGLVLRGHIGDAKRDGVHA